MNKVFFSALFSLAFLLAPCVYAQEASPLIAKADQWLEPITEAGALQAIELYQQVLKENPDDYEANWKLARAYCSILDLKTKILVEEKEEYKPLLKELGSKAEYYGERAYRINPRGVDALVWYNGAFAYHAASMGILKAILKGAGTKVKKLAEELIEIDDTYHGAFGYRILGRFYMKAPFPIGSKKKAIRALKQAIEKDPTDLQSHFFLAEAYRLKGEKEKARASYEFVLGHEPAAIEAHVGDVIKAFAQSRIQELSQ